MPTYAFFATQTVRYLSETLVQADTLQDALAEFARLSQADDGLQWDTDPYGELPTATLEVIRKDGERIRGQPEARGDIARPWDGYAGRFDLDALPEELQLLAEGKILRRFRLYDLTWDTQGHDVIGLPTEATLNALDPNHALRRLAESRGWLITAAQYEEVEVEA